MTSRKEPAVADDHHLDESQHADFDLSKIPINKIFTLIFIHDKSTNQLLLGEKQRGPLLGQWNGFGGKVEKSLLETVAESADRELAEEAFVSADPHLFPIGHIQWVVTSTDNPTYRDVMIVYKAHGLKRLPSEYAQSPAVNQGPFVPSDEMAPAWWPVENLPWQRMRVNHKVWYPYMLSDRPYRGVYWYSVVLDPNFKAENAQRESAKEIWVEDMSKRRVQYGHQIASLKGGANERGEDDVGKYTRMIFGDDQLSTRQGETWQTETVPGSPSKCASLGSNWLLSAVLQAERDLGLTTS